MAITQTSVRTVPLTHVLAAEFASMTNGKFERPMNKSRTRFLRNKLDDGLFHSPEWAVAVLNGKRFRVNGQHSAKMLASANGSLPNVPAVITEFKCDTEDDLIELFNQFDQPYSSRNTNDTISIYKSACPELDTVKATYLSRALAGVAHGLGRLTVQERARMIADNTSFILFASDYAKERRLGLVGVMNAVYRSWQTSQSAAKSFWDLVATDGHHDPQNPTRSLSNFLREITIGKSLQKYSTNDILRVCCNAWTAWRSGRSTMPKFHRGSSQPIIFK